jgi:ABC-2 type transport system ATP-binding protein
VSAAIIEVEGLSKVYPGGVRALDGLDLSVRPGEVFGFLGPNGAGKTTAVQLLIGAIRASSGGGSVLGRPLGDRLARYQLGYLPEQFQFPGFMTPRRLLDFHGRLLSMSEPDRRARAEHLLTAVGLQGVADRPIRAFSKGMQQRIGLAQSLLGRPSLLLLDEPTSGLDPIGTRNVRDLLLWLKGEGVTIFLNSHLLSEVELVCDRVAVLDRGRIVALGSLETILAPARSVRIRARGVTPAVLDELRAVTEGLQPQEPDAWQATLRDPEDVPRIAETLVRGGARIDALEPAHETLEEAFLRLVGYGRPDA